MTSATDTSRYTIYLSTGPDQKVHFEMAWQAGKGSCDRGITVSRRIAALDVDGGQDELAEKIVAFGIVPALLCKKCFLAASRKHIAAAYPRLVAAAGRFARYAIVDATDEQGTHRLQVRAHRPHPAEPTVYLVPVGEVDTSDAGDWWSTDVVRMVPADQLDTTPEPTLGQKIRFHHDGRIVTGEVSSTAHSGTTLLSVGVFSPELGHTNRFDGVIVELADIVGPADQLTAAA